jgi:hypothetical protein
VVLIEVYRHLRRWRHRWSLHANHTLLVYFGLLVVGVLSRSSGRGRSLSRTTRRSGGEQVVVETG